MYTLKDIEHKTIFVINCIEKRNLKVQNGELLLEEIGDGRNKTLTKLPFQKILMLFCIGNITITTPLIDKCKRFNVFLAVVKPNLRPVFIWSSGADANFLLRQRQYSFPKDNISIGRIIVVNKVMNQKRLLEKTRKKDPFMLSAIEQCNSVLQEIPLCNDYNGLMGMEGMASRLFFSAYFQGMEWKGRKPRLRCDALNATLDIGYTILFNYIEAFVHMFGFDIYVGIYHRLWFKRKSLICDLIEPFRCIIDTTVRNAFHRRQFKESDFTKYKGEYRLKHENNSKYYKLFFDALIPFKSDIFLYIQSYYRCFMGNKPIAMYPNFLI